MKARDNAARHTAADQLICRYRRQLIARVIRLSSTVHGMVETKLRMNVKRPEIVRVSCHDNLPKSTKSIVCQVPSITVYCSGEGGFNFSSISFFAFTAASAAVLASTALASARWAALKEFEAEVSACAAR